MEKGRQYGYSLLAIAYNLLNNKTTKSILSLESKVYINEIKWVMSWESD